MQLIDVKIGNEGMRDAQDDWSLWPQEIKSGICILPCSVEVEFDSIAFNTREEKAYFEEEESIFRGRRKMTEEES